MCELNVKLEISIVYADDTTLMSTLSAFNNHGENTVSDNINEELAKIDEWLKLNKFTYCKEI